MSERTVTIKLSAESAKFISDFMKQIETQDNRATRSPYYYTVRTVKEYSAAEGIGDVRYYCERDTETYSEEELIAHCAENDLDVEDFKDRCYVSGSQNIEEFDNVFFTEEGYKRHMELNKHNYRSEEPVTSYVKYCFRNPEIEGLFKVLTEISKEVQSITRV